MQTKTVEFKVVVVVQDGGEFDPMIFRDAVIDGINRQRSEGNLTTLEDETTDFDSITVHYVGDVSVPAASTTSVPVCHWEGYQEMTGHVMTHQFDLDDQRKTNGQAYLTLGALEGKVDDLLSVTMEVSTNPLTGEEPVPCVHVHFDADNLAMSLFKIGDDILIRPEANVLVKPEREQIGKVVETLYRVKTNYS